MITLLVVILLKVLVNASLQVSSITNTGFYKIDEIKVRRASKKFEDDLQLCLIQSVGCQNTREIC